MDLAINVVLLSLGFIGAVVAFGGDTWLKIDAPIHKRITRRGWVSVSCLLLALALGVWKEFRTDRAAADSAKERERLESELKAANSKLEASRKALVTFEPNILAAMYSLTERIVRESDFAFVSLAGRDTVIPVSTETNTPLKLYGGDEFEYSVFCDRRLGTYGEERSGIFLEVGGREYPLVGSHGSFRVAGPIGAAMDERIKNPQRLTDCDIKIIVRSTDRARIKVQYASLLRAIEEAKAAESQHP
jgi:hypothetical protein